MTPSPCSGRALWFVGLPGSGKSTIAKKVLTLLHAAGATATLLEMDQRRKVYIPSPEYTREERHKAYAMFVDEAAALVAAGDCVLMDGTANELAIRQSARQRIPDFAEIYVACSLETAIKRESERPKGKVKAELYAKALERKRTGREFPGLGQVVGVDVPFEVNPEAEVTLDSETATPEENARKVISWLHRQRSASY